MPTPFDEMHAPDGSVREGYRGLDRWLEDEDLWFRVQAVVVYPSSGEALRHTDAILIRFTADDARSGTETIALEDRTYR